MRWMSATIPPPTPRSSRCGARGRSSGNQSSAARRSTRRCSPAACARWRRSGPRSDASVYGAERDQVHAMYFEDRHLDTMDFVRDAFRDDLSLSGGLLADECAALYVGPDEEVPQDEQFNR